MMEEGRSKEEYLQMLARYYRNCTRCPLHQGRTQMVFGVGNPHSPLMIVGEGPGEQEDLQGEPFVGRAGQLLTKMLAAIGLRRQDVYITNIVKCRPPNNRTPFDEEMDACIPILRQQFAVIRPRLLLTLGAAATRAIIDRNARITQIRGQWFERNGVRMMATYHPAYLLRNPAKKAEAWEDLKAVRAALDALTGAGDESVTPPSGSSE